METITVSDILKATGGRLLSGDPDTRVTGVTTDSREASAGALFVPIVGERVDAHKFIADVFEKGASASFTQREDISCGEHALILVDDTERALIKLASWYRRLFPIPVIGITGSVGKTSTKEMVAQALSAKYKVMRTKGNYNSQIGVPLTMFNIEKDHEIAVVEMGISDMGEMDDLVDTAAPECAVVTNIGVAHILNFKKLETTLREKLRITRDFSGGDTVFLNGNDDLLKDAEPNGQVCRYGIGDEDLDYYATDIHVKDALYNFTFNYREDGELKKIPVAISMLGDHYAADSVAGLAVALKYGVDPMMAARKLTEYKGLPMRQNLIRLSSDMIIIDDTYNASPDSMKSSIRVLKMLDNPGRKIAVLADVLELGEASGDIHYELGKWIRENPVDMVFLTGAEMKEAARALKDSEVKVFYNETNSETWKILKESVSEGDAVLFKGSRGMHQEELVDKTKERYGAKDV